ncbi:hypothetical protein POM88_052899 [Heracleum sosnowskyi]|uniref:Uncharacterized protein n=1 Tax=Heracleum sosnowskyi TaxID=360622 RepID=A0AAD8GR22_9APIA|nr:hypothetical protein POM88_052899 [Heracleum sosnowskyi]
MVDEEGGGAAPTHNLVELSQASSILSHHCICIFNRYDEAYCENYVIVGGDDSHLDRIIAGIYCSTKLYLVAPIILRSVTRLLWAFDGWSRPNAISNLSTRVPFVTKGHN